METKQYTTKKPQWVNEELKKEIRKHLKTNKNKNATFQNLWDAAKAVLRAVYSNTGLPQETRKLSNDQPNLSSKRIRKRRTKPNVSRKKKIIKRRNKIETKKQKTKKVEKINETKT